MRHPLLRRANAVQLLIVLAAVNDALEKVLRGRQEEGGGRELTGGPPSILTSRILKKTWPVSKLSLPAVCCTPMRAN